MSVANESPVVAGQDPEEEVLTHMAPVPTAGTSELDPDSDAAIAARVQRRTYIFLGLTVAAVLWMTSFV